MEKILDALVDEITARVIKKLEDNTSTMLNTFKYKVSGENIEELKADHILDFDDAVSVIAEEVVTKILKNASFDVSCSP